MPLFQRSRRARTGVADSACAGPVPVRALDEYAEPESDLGDRVPPAARGLDADLGCPRMPHLREICSPVDSWWQWPSKEA